MIILNLTPHPVNIHIEDRVEVIDTFGITPRVDNEYEQAGKINGIPMIYRRAVKTTNLPQPQQNVLYIVSNIVRLENPERKDLVSPAGFIKDDKGNIIGCTSLVCNEQEATCQNLM